MPDPTLKLVVSINAEAKRDLSGIGRGIALVRGWSPIGTKVPVCDVLAVTDVLVDAVTITFGPGLGVFAAPPSAVPLTEFENLRPALRHPSVLGTTYQFDGTRFIEWGKGRPNMVGITYNPLATPAQRIVVGLTEVVRNDDQLLSAARPISAEVLGAYETVFLPAPDATAYIFVESGIAIGMLLDSSRLIPSIRLGVWSPRIVIGRPLAVSLSGSEYNNVHFDVATNAFLPGPYPTAFVRSALGSTSAPRRSIISSRCR
jgi:hypothetical protein